MALINGNDGVLQIADDVLITIIQTACLEIDGVELITSSFAGEIINIIGRKNAQKSVSIVNEENVLFISINLSIKINYKIKEVAEEVQQKVKSTVETMTSLTVGKVDVNVVSVAVEKEKTNKA